MKNLIALLLVAATLLPAHAHAGGRLRQILENARSTQPQSCGMESLGGPALESAFEAMPVGTEIKTNRFRLRTVGMEDLAEVKQVWGNEEVAKMSGDFLTEGDIQGLLLMGRPNFANFRRGTIVNFGIYEGDKLIGMCQLGGTAPERPVMKGIAKNYNENWAEVSYHLLPEAWGKGVATEVASKLVETAMSLPGVDGVQGQAIVSNEGSQKVLAKAGMKEIDRFLDPAPWSTKGGSVYFGINRADYQAATQKP